MAESEKHLAECLQERKCSRMCILHREEMD